jgi:hypothetical protein
MPQVRQPCGAKLGYPVSQDNEVMLPKPITLLRRVGMIATNKNCLWLSQHAASLKTPLNPLHMGRWVDIHDNKGQVFGASSIQKSPSYIGYIIHFSFHI